MITNDPRVVYAGPCGWCEDKCGATNSSCQPVLFLQMLGVTDYEECVAPGNALTIWDIPTYNLFMEYLMEYFVEFYVFFRGAVLRHTRSIQY